MCVLEYLRKSVDAIYLKNLYVQP